MRLYVTIYIDDIKKRGSIGNKSLGKAKLARDDEQYTYLCDIENELKHYKEHFKGKVVFCNCDDPFESNFFKYFAMNFNYLALKKLVCTCYAGSPIAQTELKDLPLFQKNERLPYMIEITEVPDINGDGATDLADIELLLKSKENVLTALDGDGDFRSEESIEFLKEADIVVTNPPFSLFREYMLQLVEYNKKFVIIGDSNKLHYKEIFPLIVSNRMWLGYNHVKEFMRPNGGTKKFGNVIWFTNLDIPKIHEPFIFCKKFDKEQYERYDNFDAINIDRVSDIPEDYFGYMGVPDSFIDSYNPDQFEIVGRSGDTEWVFNECPFFTPPSEEKIAEYKKNNKTWRLQNAYILDKNGIPNIVFSRIFIRRKK